MPSAAPACWTRAVRVQEHRGDSPDLGPQRLLQQRLQPVSLDHLRVVVEKYEHLGLAAGGRGIIERRKIEWLQVPPSADAAIAGQPGEQRRRLCSRIEPLSTSVTSSRS